MQLFTAVLAQINNPSLSNTLTNGTVDGVAFMQRLLVAFIGTLLVVAGVFFVFMILWGGIKWIIAGGDKGLVESARKILTSALIGIIVVFSIYAIVKIVGCRFFGIDLLNINIAELEVSFGSSCGGGGATGNALCAGCINGGCGTTNEVYLGAAFQNYRCTSNGWQQTADNVTSQTCLPCP